MEMSLIFWTEDLGTAEFLSVCFDESLNKTTQNCEMDRFYDIGIILKVKYKSAIGIVCLWDMGQPQIYLQNLMKD